MTIIGDWLNPTRAVGLLSYGIAVTCCAIAWVRERTQKRAWRLAALLTFIESALLLDMAFNGRWRLHQLLMDAAQRAHEYQVRRLPQLIVLIVLAGLLMVGMFRAWQMSRGKNGSLAVSGVLLAIAVWSTEVISLHQVDHVLYQRLGQFMAVSLLWLLASMMTSIGILRAVGEEGS